MPGAEARTLASHRGRFCHRPDQQRGFVCGLKIEDGEMHSRVESI